MLSLIVYKAEFPSNVKTLGLKTNDSVEKEEKKEIYKKGPIKMFLDWLQIYFYFISLLRAIHKVDYMPDI